VQAGSTRLLPQPGLPSLHTADAAFGAGLKKAQSGVAAGPGLADCAFSFTGPGGGSRLSFISGDTVCSIYSTVPTATAGQVALAKSILGG
jgi:hypothetical protein